MWGNASNDKLNDLLKLQKRAARIILQVNIDIPSINLFRKLQFRKLQNFQFWT